jgi:peptidyl-prolyl cis-trans isomerase SurA
MLLTTACSAIQSSTTSPTNSSELFSLADGMSVDPEEFEYAYQKNNFNNDKANTKKDIEEYLDLYIIFKQKVQEAKSLGKDTTNEFLTEFNSYKESLANSYINSNDLTEKLIKEAYDRYREEISAAHILIRTINDEDTLTAYHKIDSIRQLVLKGDDFTELAKVYSEDPSAAKNGGDLGYFTSMRMVYPFESAAYNTPVGEVSQVVRTKFGYHILFIKDRRSSQGKISASHIMIRTTPKDNAEKQEIARNKIFEIHDQLNNGVEWNQLCKQFSDDNNTKNKAGKLAPFGSGQMPPSFSQAAFDLQEKGQFSDPITTPFGWHIVKLDEIVPIESYGKMKPQIKNHISRDERVAITQKALVTKLKSQNGFLNLSKGSSSLNKLDSTLLIGKWEYNTSPEDSLPLFKINSTVYTSRQAYEYMVKKQKSVRGKSIKSYANQIYNKYLEESLIQYEKDHLAEKNVEYRMLVKEYWEGILLFNLMNEKVWEKAVKDTLGLQAYFTNNQNKYNWESRLNASIYDASSEAILAEISTMIDKQDTVSLESESLLNKYNSTSGLSLKVEEEYFENDDHEILKLIKWENGIQKVSHQGRFYLINVLEVIASQPKKLKECKGIVIADYQEVLEKDWVKILKEKYPANINKRVWNQTLSKLEN